MYLDMNSLPEYVGSSFRSFYKGERHINRICGENVLLIVYSGTLTFYENKKRVDVNAGEYYIQQSGMLQEGIVASDSPSYYYIHFYGSFCESSGLAIKGKADIKSLFPVFNEFDVKKQAPDFGIIEKHAYFYRILTMLQNKKISGENETAAAVAHFISENYTESINVYKIAQKFAYSEDYVIRNFKAAYNITPYEYITQLRVEKSKSLLASTNRPILQIATECGFNDTTVFYRAFVKINGVSPTIFRKQQNNI